MKTSPELQKAVAEYQKGSVEAFNTLYEQSYKYLHTCVIHVVKNEDMAMDMLQETYLEISKSISQLKSTEDFLSWAAMIANRKCFAHLKKQKDILLDGSGSGDGYSDVEDNVTDYFENIADNEEFIPETVLQDREKQRLIKEIIDGLNDMQRLCVIGFYYNEQKQEEIAEELGIPVNTVKSHLNRAKAKIKEAVVELDVKKGTRLYSFAPFMALLFKEEVQACVLRPMSKGLASAVGISASGAVGSALPGGLEAVKEYITENFGETLGEIFADTIGKAAIKVKALWAKFTAASIQTKAVVATTACAVTIGGVAAVMSPQKEVVDVLSADLDIVVTEEKIMTSIEGTTWEMLISSNKKGTDLLDLYDYFMKNFNRKHNENVEDIVEENGQVEVKIDGEYVISEQTKEYLDLLLDIKAREAYSEIFNIDFTKYEFGANYKEKSMFWEDIPIKHVGGEGINEIVFYDGKHNKLVKDYTGFGMGINGCSYTIANFVNGKIQGQATNIYIHDVSAYNWDTWEYAYSGNYQVTEFNVQSNSIVGSVISTWYGDSFTGFDRQREQFRKYTGNVDYVDVEYDHMVMETNFGYDEEDFMRSNKKYYIYVGEVDVIRKTSMDKPDEPLPIFNYKIYLTENGAFDDLKNNIIREEEDNGAGGINYDVYIERDLDNNGYMEYEPLHVYYGYEGGYEFIIPIDIDYIK